MNLKKNQLFSCRKIIGLLLCTFFIMLMTGCQRTSPEKITQAQETYQKLVETHNLVVEAHKNIDDSSLDSQLVVLAQKITQVESYNLNEMTDEEIDLLITSINSIIGSYEDYLHTIETIQAQEDAAVLTPIYYSIQNNTELTFTKLLLYEKNSSATKINVLEDFEGFVPKQYLAGLTVYRNADSTPWMLELEDTEGVSYKIELPIDSYESKEYSLRLTYDAELEELKCS